jgi:phage protein D
MFNRDIDVSRYSPDFKIYVNKSKDPNGDLRSSAASIKISEKINDSAQYDLVLSDVLHAVKQGFQWLDNGLIDLGNFIGIDMGYTGSKFVRMIEGPIKSLSTSGFSGDIPKVTLVGYDKSHQILTEKSTSPKSLKPGVKTTYSEIAKNVATEVGLEAVVDPTKEYDSTITKKPVTYNEFLLDAAKRVGFEFFVSRGKLHFVNPSDPKKKPTPKMTLEWGKDVIQFTPTINTANLVTGVEVRGHLPHSKAKVVAIATSGSETVYEQGTTGSQIAKKLSNGKENIKTLEDKVFSSKEEAEDIAKAELERLNRDLVTGAGTIVGNPDMIPGITIRLNRLGKRFTGNWYVTSVTNTIDSSGFATSFNVRRNVIGFV